METTYDFITKYYPGYDSSEIVANADVLQRYVDGEEVDDDDVLYAMRNVPLRDSGLDELTEPNDQAATIALAITDGYLYKVSIGEYLKTIS